MRRSYYVRVIWLGDGVDRNDVSASQHYGPLLSFEDAEQFSHAATTGFNSGRACAIIYPLLPPVVRSAREYLDEKAAE